MKDVSRLTTQDSVLVVVDIQEKLVAKIPSAETLLKNVSFLLDAANLLQVPQRVTEQYPKGLGSTVTLLKSKLSAEAISKTAFSCCGAPGFLADLRELNRQAIVLVGMEAHVCVLQTALDLLEASFQVYLPVDALASRTTLDSEIGLRRLERAGAILCTCESTVFEWLGDSTHPQFKAISKLIIERSASA
jgi:nicotinamidase-related amidase